jgi:hypothetical protein
MDLSACVQSATYLQNNRNLSKSTGSRFHSTKFARESECKFARSTAWNEPFCATFFVANMRRHATLEHEIRWPRRVLTLAEAMKYIDATGYGMLFPVKNIPLPSLREHSIQARDPGIAVHADCRPLRR